MPGICSDFSSYAFQYSRGAPKLPGWHPLMLSSTIKRLVFGSEAFHHQCTLGLPDPQPEVAVWLHWIQGARDVTFDHAIACPHPLRIGIGFKRNAALFSSSSKPILRFVDRAGQQLLGEVSLDLKESIPLGPDQVVLFGVRNCRNYCVPQHQLWSNYIRSAWKHWRTKNSADTLTLLERRSLFVAYICPRPVVLVSVMDGNDNNIFPMDLIGPMGEQHFSLALHNTSSALPLIDRARRVVLSSVPIGETKIAYELGKNHHQPGIQWAQLPFPTTYSATLHLPVPKFALRVRELEVDCVRNLGSHSLLLARVLCDRKCSEGAQLHFIHGFYGIRRGDLNHRG
jgi:flavin reductase (DIM6/NTAB) family NADH-FMN oxidoreductase RutF